MNSAVISPGQTWTARARGGGSVRVSLVSPERIGFVTGSGGTAYLTPVKFCARYRRAA